MADSVLDPQDKMRSRDVGRVARGEQAPRPPHEYGTVSKPPPPSSTDPKPKALKRKDEGQPPADEPRFSDQLRDCSIRYYEYYRCIHENEKEKDKSKCQKFAKEYQTLCPHQWISKWDEERKQGLFPGPL